MEPVQSAPFDIPTRRNGRRPAPRRRRRRGFTLLEILVVIGIIMLLIAIGVIAFGALDQSAKVTKTTLSNMKSMLAEYEQRTSLREQPQQMYNLGGTLTAPNPNGTPPVDLWRNEVILNVTDTGAVMNGGDERYDWGAMGNTQIVLNFLNRLPENKQLFTRLPSKQIHGRADTEKKVPKLTPLNDKLIIDPPLVLDAWNNPIIYVGSDGLAGVTFESRKEGTTADKEYRVTSTGVIPAAGLNPNNRSKSWRPFFASAGPDGDFRKGDDNLYSFDQ